MAGTTIVTSDEGKIRSRRRNPRKKEHSNYEENQELKLLLIETFLAIAPFWQSRRPSQAESAANVTLFRFLWKPAGFLELHLQDVTISGHHLVEYGIHKKAEE